MMGTKLYAIIITKTKQILDPDSFREYWKGYGGSGLYGWRKPKKIYLKLHQAKTGFSHIPEAMKEHLSIAEFSIGEILMDGEQLRNEQEQRRVEKEAKLQKKRAKYQLQQAQKEFETAKKKLESLQ